MALLVNEEKCTKCGICADVCPGGIIRIGEKGPKMLAEKGCIRCGHCVAVCPSEALDNESTPRALQTAIAKFPVIDAEMAAAFLRSRRSTRVFKKELPSKEVLLKLLDIARFAPSGGNSQGVSYVVIQDQETMKKVTETVIGWLEEQVTKGAAWSAVYSGLVAIYRKTGKDVILRGAPALIIALTPKNLIYGRDNARFALTYADVYANTLGLGTCFAGFVEACAAAKHAPLLELLKVPEDKVISGAMMVGYPKYTYRRLVDRNPLEVSWV